MSSLVDRICMGKTMLWLWALHIFFKPLYKDLCLALEYLRLTSVESYVVHYCVLQDSRLMSTRPSNPGRILTIMGSYMCKLIANIELTWTYGLKLRHV